MKCPHCEKEIDINSVREIDILQALENEVHTISSLSKKLMIPRSTLNYHLNDLEKKGIIKTERLENLTGRPTIIKKQND